MLRREPELTTAAGGCTANKLARQLDFTANVLLPENPEAELKSGISAPDKPSQIITAELIPAGSVLQRSTQTVPAVKRVAHQRNHPIWKQLIGKEPSKVKEPSNAKLKNASAKQPKQCNCRYSRCLKLYCECFASGIVCDGCSCTNCHNSSQNEAERREAIETILERKPDAFRPKIADSPPEPRVATVEACKAMIVGKHNKGCNCKKSGCLKKYCECFAANVLCSDNCKCKGCKNVEGSNARISLLAKGRANALISVNEAVNAAISGVPRSSDFTGRPPTKKRKTEELSFVARSNDEAINRLENFRQENFLTPPVASLSPSSTVSSSGSLKPRYRSLLVDNLQLRSSNELCSLLVVISAEAAKKFSERNNTITRGDVENVENTIVASTQECKDIHDRDDVQKLSSNEVDGTLDYTCQPIVASHHQTGRALSPDTLALICDERDIVTTRTESPTGVLSLSKNATIESSCLHAFNEVDAEQERLVLTEFCGFLNQLITCGGIKETSWLSSSRDGQESQQHNGANWHHGSHNSNAS